MLYRNLLKPFFDRLIGFIGLVATSPIFLLVFLILLIQNRGHVFFVQPRPGLNKKIFHLIKFKTMNDRRDAERKLLPDRDRITKIGKWVRATSIDELPQLINVIKGDMSLIGPRPLLAKYLPLYNDFQKRRHEVKPGITGWAQVNGRNAVSWQKRFELDVWYVDNLSFSLDVRILLLTFMKVLKRDGINASSEQTMSAFTGNE